MGRIAEAEQIWRELVPLARRLGHTISPPESGEFTGVTLLRTGDIDVYDAYNQRELERIRNRQRPGGNSPGQVGGGVVHFWRGRWREALAAFEEVMKDEPPGTLYGIGPAFTMLARAYLGDREGGTGHTAPEGARRIVRPFRIGVAIAPHDSGRPQIGPRLRGTPGPDA
jgi:hypothetical protein